MFIVCFNIGQNMPLAVNVKLILSSLHGPIIQFELRSSCRLKISNARWKITIWKKTFCLFIQQITFSQAYFNIASLWGNGKHGVEKLNRNFVCIQKHNFNLLNWLVKHQITKRKTYPAGASHLLLNFLEEKKARNSHGWTKHSEKRHHLNWPQSLWENNTRKR